MKSMKHMKKLIALALCLMMLAALAACGNNDTPDTSDTPDISDTPDTPDTPDEPDNTDTPEQPDITPVEGDPADALELLEQVWNTYAEDEKFAAAGGDYDHSVDGAPGTFDISKADNVEYMLTLPQDSVALIDGAASLMHMMNSNTFTCGAFHPIQQADADTLTQTLRDAIQGKQWMCGFPDKLVVAKVNGYVVSFYGNQELVDTFRDKLSAVWGDTQIVFDEAIQ